MKEARVSYIHFVDSGTTMYGLTRIWLVKTLAGGSLGEIRWYAPWRKYCFYPQSETVFDKGCLRDIADFCENRTEEIS